MNATTIFHPQDAVVMIVERARDEAEKYDGPVTRYIGAHYDAWERRNPELAEKFGEDVLDELESRGYTF